LLIRGTYAKAFKAPSLYALYAPLAVFNIRITDPQTGNTYRVPTTFGGNPDLSPQTGRSRTFGLVYSSEAIRDLQLSITNWSVRQNNTIQPNITASYILANPNLFPGRVIRDSNGVITKIIDTQVNFG